MVVDSLETVAPTTDDAGESSHEMETRRVHNRSTVAFPYGDLDDAVEIAQAIHRNAGMQCSLDQLAGWMHHTTSSGAFRLKIATARVFGVIEGEREVIRLTALGRRLVDPQQAAVARADAFLAVPLYQRIHDRYRGHPLPRDVALEREMVGFGVAEKQKAKARQAFHRSAEQAGFYVHGRERLILPAGAGAIPAHTEQATDAAAGHRPQDRPPAGAFGGGGGELPPLDPLLQGLLQRLPAPGSPWPSTQRKLWLDTLTNVISLLYPDGDTSNGRA